MVWALHSIGPDIMRSRRTILLVEDDPGYAQALSLVLRQQGDLVEVVQNRAQALAGGAARGYDLAVVDLFTRGGGAELARELSRRVPRLVLSHGARAAQGRAAGGGAGLPGLPQGHACPTLLRGRGASSNGTGSEARRPGSRRPAPDASGSSRGPRARARRRARPG